MSKPKILLSVHLNDKPGTEKIILITLLLRFTVIKKAVRIQLTPIY